MDMLERVVELLELPVVLLPLPLPLPLSLFIFLVPNPGFDVAFELERSELV